ncbi:hypothetical protein [Mycobacterium sp. CnD-18-1]|uniref:hypothetical protein n=1 Tax=Mycobacterium sp. CnD-18-1 TaxID=2917744 RepID=UPI001EF26CAA|nr:hypothetical protein [Mycobacterium sp. CnD-18-1]MCG7607101.1 hypothetical protein [Mycobacterium sp. CnD-18-1]
MADTFTLGAGDKRLHYFNGRMQTINEKPRPFTACTECPRCDLVAVHWLDEPRKATDEDWAAYREALAIFDPFAGETKHVSFGGGVIKRVTDNPRPQPPDNEDFTVARICVDCGYRWGMN